MKILENGLLFLACLVGFPPRVDTKREEDAHYDYRSFYQEPPC